MTMRKFLSVWGVPLIISAGIAVIVMSVMVQFILYAQEKKSYDLTETQTLRLKVKQLEYVSAFEHYQQAVGAFNAEVKAVEKEHDWPETVQFDPNTLTFREPAPSPKKSDSENPARPPLMQQTDPVKKPQPKKDEGAK